MSTLADFRLSPRARELLRSLVPVMCPADAGELGITEAIIDYVETYVRALPPLPRAGLVAGLMSYDLGARLDPRNRGKRASQLDPVRGKAYFELWRHGLAPQRAFAQGLKGLVAMSYYEMPEALAKLDYHPSQWVAGTKKRRLEKYSEEIARHEKALFERDPIFGARADTVPFPAPGPTPGARKEAS